MICVKILKLLKVADTRMWKNKNIAPENILHLAFILYKNRVDLKDLPVLVEPAFFHHLNCYYVSENSCYQF